MGKKGQKATLKQSTAGQKNLERWLEQNPQRGFYKHGGHSRHVAQKYQDKRTREGKQLAAIREAIITDIGGQGALNAGQRLMLDNLMSVLVVITQVGKYVDEQPSVITGGDLLPVLRKSFISYLNTCGRLVETLYGLRKPKDRPDLKRYLEETYGKDEK
jgi:hypothetical protein